VRCSRGGVHRGVGRQGKRPSHERRRFRARPRQRIQAARHGVQRGRRHAEGSRGRDAEERRSGGRDVEMVLRPHGVRRRNDRQHGWREGDPWRRGRSRHDRRGDPRSLRRGALGSREDGDRPLAGEGRARRRVRRLHRGHGRQAPRRARRPFEGASLHRRQAQRLGEGPARRGHPRGGATNGHPRDRGRDGDHGRGRRPRRRGLDQAPRDDGGRGRQGRDSSRSSGRRA
jgi:hypothetical protein